MGTEITLFFVKRTSIFLYSVKLNDPLMGTEITPYGWEHFRGEAQELN